ncbi:MAG: hypothetical protein JNK32_01185 [Anaerolineales bacterium]|nr:hypothetical protein [Anaerolineales bacterium]
MLTYTTKFIRFLAFELIVSGLISAIISAVQGYESLLALSVFVIAVGGVIFLTSSNAFIRKLVETAVASRFGRWLGFIPLVLITLFLFAYQPGKAILSSLGAVLFAFWLIGVEFLWFANHPRKGTTQRPESERRRSTASLLALILAFGFLLIPSRLPSLLGGIPIDQPIEFIVSAFLLPLVWIIDRSFFSRRFVMVSLLILVAAKLTLYLILPQSGFGVGAFRTEDVFSIKESERGYTSWLNSPYSAVMEMPYTSVREFPVEWVNDRLGYDFEKFQILVGVGGYVRVRDEGKIVFIVKGARSYSGNIVNTQTSIVLDDYADLNKALYEELPSAKEFQIRVETFYTKFGEARLDPVLLYPDGSYKSLFEKADVWMSKEGSLLSGQTTLFRSLQNLLALFFMTGLIFSGAKGLMGLLNQNRISEADIYLVLTGLLTYFVALLVDKQQIPLVLMASLVFTALVKIIDFKLRPTRPTIRSFVLFAGVLFLFGYLALDINNLRSIASLPEGQDGLEYQTFARNIFVNGDEFLAQTPPRAYKILFPYLVGLLHVGFGQSAAAQFFMNAWCGVLSAALTFALAKYFKLSLTVTLLASTSFLMILCLPSSFIYYFRFGLIEPAAVLCLMLTLFFAAKRRRLEMTLAAILTVLLRLDYLGLVLASFLLWSDPVTGGFSSAWASLWSWTMRNLKPYFAYAALVILPSLFIISAYYVFVPNYMLSASDVSQSSFLSMLDGFMRVLLGGNLNDFREKISQGSFEFLLIVLPLALGFLVSMLSIFHRRDIFARIDLRLALLIPAILPAYIAVRPAAYFPRFSFPLLGLDIILLGMVFYFVLLRHNKSS